MNQYSNNLYQVSVPLLGWSTTCTLKYMQIPQHLYQMYMYGSFCSCVFLLQFGKEKATEEIERE